MRYLGAFLYLFLFLSCRERPSQPVDESFTLHSAQTRDDYVIRVKRPAGFQTGVPYRLVLVADGSIGLGEYVMGADSNWKATQPADAVFVTIGHTGKWEDKRSRDFIPSDAGGYQDPNFGHADLFYAFLKTELFPLLDQKFPNRKSRAFVGHSFSGLFCLYA